VSFNYTFRYIVDVLSINCNNFHIMSTCYILMKSK
jgi:hypothetical protein